MHSLTIISALALLVAEASATACCSKLPYAIFTPLSKHPAAQSFCSQKYPIPRPTCLFTTTLPSTTTISKTTSVAPVTATVTVTTGDASTTVITDTITPDAITTTITVPTEITITSCVPTITVVKRTNPKTTAKTTAKTTDKLAPIFSSLQKQASSFVKTLCSCIETTPGCSTKTIITRPLKSTTQTATITLKPVLTTSVPNTVVVTVHTTVTLAPVDATVSVTATATSTYCPPPPPPAPSCNAAKCSADFFCTPDQACVCLLSVEGETACSDTNAIVSNCAATTACDSSADCGSNQRCVTNLCCNDKQCITIKTDTCPNGRAVSRVFKAAKAGSGGAPKGGNFPQ